MELVGAEAAVANQIPLAVVLPFPDPASNWPDEDRQRFDQAFANAAYDVTLDGDPAQPGTALKLRNAAFVHAALGAIVVDNEALASEFERSGLTVIRL